MLTSAEETSSPSGKLRIQNERIGKDSQKESYLDIETELEKKAPNLFNDETGVAIQERQEAELSERKALEEILFVTIESKKGAIEETKETLFASDYAVPKTTSDNEIVKGEIGGNMLFYILLSVVVLICGGVFVAMRKM